MFFLNVEDFSCKFANGFLLCSVFGLFLLRADFCYLLSNRSAVLFGDHFLKIPTWDHIFDVYWSARYVVCDRYVLENDQGYLRIWDLTSATKLQLRFKSDVWLYILTYFISFGQCKFGNKFNIIVMLTKILKCIFIWLTNDSKTPSKMVSVAMKLDRVILKSKYICLLCFKKISTQNKIRF